MPPSESLRPARKDDVDEYVRIQVTEAPRPSKVSRRAAILVEDFSWSDAPERRGNRRHPAADAEDWGLAGRDGWEAEPEHGLDRPWAARQQPVREGSAREGSVRREPVREESVRREPVREESARQEPVREGSARQEARRERSARAARAGLADEWDGSQPAAPEGTRARPEAGLAIGLPVGGEGAREAAAHEPVLRFEQSAADDIWADRAGAAGGRRTVVITGRGSERRHDVSGRSRLRRRSWEASLPVHERAGFRPDRVAMWAVLLGLILLLVAATSSHAAVLAAHLAR